MHIICSCYFSFFFHHHWPFLQKFLNPKKGRIMHLNLKSSVKTSSYYCFQEKDLGNIKFCLYTDYHKLSSRIFNIFNHKLCFSFIARKCVCKQNKCRVIECLIEFQEILVLVIFIYFQGTHNTRIGPNCWIILRKKLWKIFPENYIIFNRRFPLKIKEQKNIIVAVIHMKYWLCSPKCYWST